MMKFVVLAGPDRDTLEPILEMEDDSFAGPCAIARALSRTGKLALVEHYAPCSWGTAVTGIRFLRGHGRNLGWMRIIEPDGNVHKVNTHWYAKSECSSKVFAHTWSAEG